MKRFATSSSCRYCNTRFGRGVWPFFYSYWIEEEPPVIISASAKTGAPKRTVRHRYLTEDFAFCQRAREAGLKIMADTTDSPVAHRHLRLRLGRSGQRSRAVRYLSF